MFIAVGSNIGDRIGHIRRAVQELEANGCTLLGTSRLYESKPMYVEDQDLFINGVIEVSYILHGQKLTTSDLDKSGTAGPSPPPEEDRDVCRSHQDVP